MLGQGLDSVILEVSANLDDSVILWGLITAEAEASSSWVKAPKDVRMCDILLLWEMGL